VRVEVGHPHLRLADRLLRTRDRRDIPGTSTLDVRCLPLERQQPRAPRQPLLVQEADVVQLVLNQGELIGLRCDLALKSTNLLVVLLNPLLQDRLLAEDGLPPAGENAVL